MPTDFSFDQSPSNPLDISGGFSFSADQGQSAALQQTLDNAKGVADMLSGHANTSMIQQVAGSAAVADSLTLPISNSIQQQLIGATETLGKLQSPIEQGIVTSLSSIGGNAVSLGANLPTGSGATESPLCVQIATDAARGSINAALGYVTSNIAPFVNPRTQQYYANYNFLAGCMSAYPALWTQVQQAISSITTELSIMPASIVGSGPPPSQSGQTGSIALPGSQYTVPVAPQLYGNQTGMSQHLQPQTTLLTDNPLLTQPYAPPNAPVVPTTGSMIPGSGAPPTMQSGPITAAIPGSGAPPVSSGIPLQQTPGVSSIPGSGPNGETLCQNQFGQSWYIPAGMTCGSGPPPSVPYPQIPPTTEQPPTTTTQPPPGSTYRPETPAKPSTQQPCIKICKDEPPKCDDKQYCVWQDGDTRICYVLPADQPPRRQFDKKLTCGVPSDSWLSAVMNQCGMQKPQQPNYPIPTGGLPGFNQEQGCDNLYRFQSLAQPLTGDFFTALIANIIDSLPPLKGFGFDIADSIANAFRKSAGETVGSALDTILTTALTGPLNCSGTPAETGIIAARCLTGLVSRWLSGAAEPADTSLSYAQNSLCPFRIPSNGEAVGSWLANNISIDRLRCIVEANGNRWDSFYPVADASRTKLSIGEYATLLRRQFMTQQQYEQKIREAGLLRDDDKFLAYQLTEYIPSPSDIIPLMIRDTADTVNIDWSESDKIFADKYISPLSDWGDKQGVSREFMQLLWRGHWILPPPTQLTEMLHRNSRLPADDPAYVDLARVRKTLLQQDIHPNWVDAYIAISYAPLTRIDATRAYRVGAIDVSGLKEAYLNLGYTSDTADTLVRFNVINTQQQILRRPEIRQYSNGEITASEMYDSLRTFGARDEDLPVALQRGQAMLSINRRKRCVASIRKRFLLAELSLIDVQTELQQQGLDQQQVEQISAGFQCERNAKGKTLSGSAILSLYRDGVITESDTFDRLLRVGYDEDEASLLVRQAAQRIQIKLNQQQLRDLKQQQRDAQKLKNAIEKQNRQAASQQAKLQASADRARKTKELREKRLLEAAAKVQEHTGMAYSDSVFYVRNLHIANITTTAATPDESINAIGVAASDSKLKDTDSISAAVSVSIAALI